jgi:predicted permease
MSFLFTLLNLFRRDHTERDLDAEVRAHLELLTDEKLLQGMSRKEAHRAACIELGGVEQVKEEVRSARAGAWLEQLFHDVRYAARQLRRNPGFTAMAGLALALGIGLNAAIFTLFNAALLRPLQGHDPQRLVSLYSTVRDEPGPGVFSYPEYAFCRGQNSVFSGVAAFAGGRVQLTATGGAPATTPQWLHAQLVSGNLFSVLGAVPLAGRTFLAEEDQTPGAHPVALISYDFWQSHFGGDPGAIGETLTLNALQYTIVGVAPRGFIGTDPEVPDVWIPLAMSANVQSGPSLFENREAGWLFLLARLNPGVPLATAQAEMAVLAARFHAADSETLRRSAILVTPAGFLSPSQRSDTLPFAVILMVAVGLVLLIACANVANLQLARGVARQKELGIRTAMGGSRARLVQQLMVESLLLSGMAGAAGLLIAWWTAGLVLGLAHPPGTRALALEVSPDWRVALYLGAVSVTSGVLSGLLPALRISRQDPLHAIREESGAQTWRRGAGLRSVLVVSQVALSLFLLVAAGLLARALGKARSVDPGFDAGRVAVLSPDLRLHGYDPARAVEFDRRVAERLSGLPGVGSVALARTVPLGDSFAQTGIVAEGQEFPAGQRAPVVDFNVVSPEFFDTLGIGLVRGRSFTPNEIASGARVAVVSQALARRLWPSEDALGKRLRQGRTSPLYEVVGVARDTRNVYLWSGALPYLYLPAIAQNLDKYSDLSVLVRFSGNAAALAPALPGIARELDPAVTAKAFPLADNLAFWVWPSQIGAALSATLGLLALLLASVGIASITAFAVTQRTREIGIRMALGAAPAAVLGLLVRQTGRLVAIGTAIGLTAAAAASRVLAQFLYGLSAVDCVAFVGTTLLLAAATLAACCLPARRAARVDPMVALRNE